MCHLFHISAFHSDWGPSSVNYLVCYVYLGTKQDQRSSWSYAKFNYLPVCLRRCPRSVEAVDVAPATAAFAEQARNADNSPRVWGIMFVYVRAGGSSSRRGSLRRAPRRIKHTHTQCVGGLGFKLSEQPRTALWGVLSASLWKLHQCTPPVHGRHDRGVEVKKESNI